MIWLSEKTGKKGKLTRTDLKTEMLRNKLPNPCRHAGMVNRR